MLVLQAVLFLFLLWLLLQLQQLLLRPVPFTFSSDLFLGVVEFDQVAGTTALAYVTFGKNPFYLRLYLASRIGIPIFSHMCVISVLYSKLGHVRTLAKCALPVSAIYFLILLQGLMACMSQLIQVKLWSF